MSSNQPNQIIHEQQGNKRLHQPVLLKEVLENLNIKDGATYVDCTFGFGGYTKAMLEQKNCNVVSIDQDPTTKQHFDKIAAIYENRAHFINDNFRNINKLVSNFAPVDGIVYDLGVSSMQLDDKSRGFSFDGTAKLDMRMSLKGVSAYDVVNQYEETLLADIIYNYGGERNSRKIAKKIVETRLEAPIETTNQLANIIRSVTRKTGKIDPATKTFQAIRIEVNDEMGAIETSLSRIQDILKIGARVVVVSFHELEDRIVKKFFTDSSSPKIASSKYAPVTELGDKPFKLISRKSIKPTRAEILANPRSRSAHLRVVERVQMQNDKIHNEGRK